MPTTAASLVQPNQTSLPVLCCNLQPYALDRQGLILLASRIGLQIQHIAFKVYLSFLEPNLIYYSLVDSHYELSAATEAPLSENQ